jgi:hypothetical protein
VHQTFSEPGFNAAYCDELDCQPRSGDVDHSVSDLDLASGYQLGLSMSEDLQHVGSYESVTDDLTILSNSRQLEQGNALAVWMMCNDDDGDKDDFMIAAHCHDRVAHVKILKLDAL